jgi:hypothetical protein
VSEFKYLDTMTKSLLTFTFILVLLSKSKAQYTVNDRENFHSQSFGIQGGLSLLENPFVLYPIINLSYSRTIIGFKKNQLAILTRVGAIILPDIETKFLVSTSLQYKYVSRKRFEADLFLGINYQLRRLAYDRYQFENNILENKGRLLHQFGPTAGINIGYKVIKKKSYSISPFLGVSLTKLNKIYQPDLFAGYKPSLTFGFTFNK